MRKLIAISGAFDPLHHGHIRMLKDASAIGDIIIILNTDEWVLKNKGYVEMPYEQRREVMLGIKGVISVMQAQDSDNTVSKTIDNMKGAFDYFGKGGSRTAANTPEAGICQKHGIKVLYGLGGSSNV